MSPDTSARLAEASNLLNRAAVLQTAGFVVFKGIDKRPAQKWKAGHTDPHGNTQADRLEGSFDDVWCSDGREAHATDICIRLDGLTVIDFDSSEGIALADDWLEEQGHTWPVGFTVKTKRGLHRYFRGETAFLNGKSAKPLGFADIKSGPGSQCVGPGSQWDTPGHPGYRITDAGDIPEQPEWLDELFAYLAAQVPATKKPSVERDPATNKPRLAASTRDDREEWGGKPEFQGDALAKYVQGYLDEHNDGEEVSCGDGWDDHFVRLMGPVFNLHTASTESEIAELAREVAGLMSEDPPDDERYVLKAQCWADGWTKTRQVPVVELADDATAEAKAIVDRLSSNAKARVQRLLDERQGDEALAKLDELQDPPAPLPTFSKQEMQALDDPEWLLEGIVPLKSVGQFIAPSGSGKTYIALALSEAIASGATEFGGIPLNGNHRKVFYCAYESETAIMGRMEALAQHHGRQWPEDNLRFWLASESDRPLALDTATGVNTLRATLKETGFDEGLALLVIDTQALALPGADENSNDDWNSLIGRIKKLAADLGCAVIFVSHPGHGGKKARGASSQEQSLDFTLSIERGSVKLGKSRRSAGDRAVFGIGWAENINIGTSITERAFVPKTPTSPKRLSISEIHDAAYATERQIPGLLVQFKDANRRWPKNQDEAAEYISAEIPGLTPTKAKKLLTELKREGTIVFDREGNGGGEWRPVEPL